MSNGAETETALAGALTARRAWREIAEARVRLLNSAENLTFLAEGEAGRFVMRRHRVGYHSRAAIESELAWSAALSAESALSTPVPARGADGAFVQEIDGVYWTLLRYIEGAEPVAGDDLAPWFRRLGAMAAETHAHSLGWARPEGFVRLTWDLDAVVGPAPIWGAWREGPNVGAAEAAIIGAAEARMREELEAYGAGEGRFGLIHADMRLANLLIHEGDLRLIDFDDCGFGWLMYDFAAAVSFMETDPRVPALKAAWLEGYAAVRTLSDADVAIVDALVMFRRLALLGWIGTRMEAREPQALAPHFAAGSAALAAAYLES